MNKSINVMFAAIAGFVAGMLIAPKSGAETRRELRVKAREAKERMDVRADEAMKAAREATETIKEGASHAEKEARGFAENARESARILAGDAKSRASRVAHETRQAVAAKKDVE